jgi:hypothetical protein
LDFAISTALGFAFWPARKKSNKRLMANNQAPGGARRLVWFFWVLKRERRKSALQKGQADLWDFKDPLALRFLGYAVTAEQMFEGFALRVGSMPCLSPLISPSFFLSFFLSFLLDPIFKYK